MAESDKPRVVAVVPARFASTRFPGKIITPLLGHPLVYHTCQRAREASLIDHVVVATDHAAVMEALAPYDVQVVMTRDDHPTGTDRIAEVARSLDANIIVNVQGDEPAVDPTTIDEAIRPLLKDDTLSMSTARRRITSQKSVSDPNIVKVVCNRDGHALYFSRHPIPYYRDGDTETEEHWQHIGLYVYRRDFLLSYSAMAQTPLEKAEKLEQLRVLEHGYRIAVVETEYAAVGVDVPEDLEHARELLLLQREAVKG